MWTDKIKKEFENDPLKVIMITALATTALAKLIDATSAAKGRRAYARQIDYKIRNRK